MEDINRVNVTGHLTRDPKVRVTAGGTTIANFGIAVNDRRKNQQTGEWEDSPNFVDCIMFGNRAESLSRILTKGMFVCIEGRIHWSQWERDGQKRSKIDIIVDKIRFAAKNTGQGENVAYTQSYAATDPIIEDEDIPF